MKKREKELRFPQETEERKLKENERKRKKKKKRTKRNGWAEHLVHFAGRTKRLLNLMPLDDLNLGCDVKRHHLFLIRV
jgi:hypothetical protein